MGSCWKDRGTAADGSGRLVTLAERDARPARIRSTSSRLSNGSVDICACAEFWSSVAIVSPPAVLEHKSSAERGDEPGYPGRIRPGEEPGRGTGETAD